MTGELERRGEGVCVVKGVRREMHTWQKMVCGLLEDDTFGLVGW
jgi:hypothetical protein